MSTSRSFLHELKRSYLFLQGLEIFLLSLSFSLLSFSLLRLIIPLVILQIAVPVLLFTSIILISIYKRGLSKLELHHVASYLSSLYPSLQESTDLLVKDSHSLTNLQALQRARVEKEFELLKNDLKLPHRLGATSLLLLISLMSSLLFYLAEPIYSTSEETNLRSFLEAPATLGDSLLIQLEEVKLHTQAPAYTGIQAGYATSLNTKVPEGSKLTWTIIFSQTCDKVGIVISGRDSLIASSLENGKYTIRHTLTQSTFYQVYWQYKGENFQSDFYKLESIVDEAPQIAVNNLAQFTELKHTDNLTISLEALIRDDYGLKDANIIATVSKGSGESVKFREETMRFARPATINGKQVNANTSFNLLKLGLEPGDELYFYIQAEDGKTPTPNRSRTETHIISLRDTANYITSADEGLGVDLMPEYFRSQRQIIIDSEKLLKNKKSLSKEEFNFTSNALGYDQKVLRLRYSEFMGEEFVSGIGPEASHEEEHGEENDVLKEFGHLHDSENEHNLVEEKHDHENEIKDPDKKENPIEEFAHLHDDTEEATFYIQSVKAKLRAALTMMWDAELHLRLFDPQKSLPYQYKILNLLKEIANDSRIYVHRSGFDPPPIKEDKRYSADLSEIHNSTNQYATEKEDAFKSIREAVTLVSHLQEGGLTSLTTEDIKRLNQAGQTLAALSIDDPVRYLQALRAIHAVTNATTQSSELVELLKDLQYELWESLPAKGKSLTPHIYQLHALDKAMIQELEKRTNE